MPQRRAGAAPLDIVLCATRAGSRYGADDYIHAGCGFGRDATLTRAVALVD